MAQNDQNSGLQIQVPGMDQFKDLKFLQSETNPTDLVVQLPDGTEVVFPNYIALAQAGAAPEITLEDGTVVPGQEIVSLIENLDYDLIAPAAGNEGEAPNGGGAGFSSLELDPDDDIGHGPYANKIEIADEVGFDQYRGYQSEDGGDTEVPVITTVNNVGDDFALMNETTVDLADRPSTGSFLVEFETQALDSPVTDWDGMRIFLQSGETVTITYGDAASGYYIALETDPSVTNGFDPLYYNNYAPFTWDWFFGTRDDLDWEHVTLDGSISYSATEDGYVYIGTGFQSYTETGSYFTDILVEGDDGRLAGTNGDDILVGGARNDQMTGGAGSDRFVFNDATIDGDDTILDFETTLGGATENDVIDLDALFDAVVPGADEATRLGYVDVDTATGVLTVDTGSGTIAGFSIDLGVTGQSEVDLFNNGNLVVDES